MPSFRERLWPSWRAWLVIEGLIGLLAWAYGIALGGVVGAGFALVGTGAAIAIARLSSPLIVLTSTRLQVGQATLPIEAIAAVQSVSRPGIAELRGPHADARLYVELRPWAAREAILIAIDDPSDPHPAWLVTTRHPDRLQAALAATMSTNKGDLL